LTPGGPLKVPRAPNPGVEDPRVCTHRKGPRAPTGSNGGKTLVGLICPLIGRMHLGNAIPGLLGETPDDRPNFQEVSPGQTETMWAPEKGSLGPAQVPIQR